MFHINPTRCQVRVIFSLSLLILIMGSHFIVQGQHMDRQGHFSSYHSSDGTLTGEWTLGETAIQYVQQGSFRLYEGFLHPDVSGFTNITTENLSKIEVFPNPTSGYMTIRHNLKKKLHLKVFDLLGQIQHKQIDILSPTQVNLSSLPQGSYLLSYILDGQMIGSTLIMKIK